MHKHPIGPAIGSEPTIDLRPARNGLAIRGRTGKKASTDAVAGLLNRRGMKRYAKTITAADLSTVGIILLDLDHLKQADDAYGHGAGNAVLVEAATGAP